MSSACYGFAVDQAGAPLVETSTPETFQRLYSPYVELGTNWILSPYLRAGILHPIGETTWILDGAVLASTMGSVSGALGAQKCFGKWAVGPEAIVGRLFLENDFSFPGVFILAGARAFYSLGASGHALLTLGGYICITSPYGSLNGGPVLSIGLAYAF